MLPNWNRAIDWQKLNFVYDESLSAVSSKPKQLFSELFK